MEQLTLTVKGMTCGGCENAVKRIVSMVDGVSEVTASHRDDRVTVIYDAAKAAPAAIREAIATSGYQVVGEADRL